MRKIVWTHYVAISLLVWLMGATQLSAMGGCTMTFSPAIDMYTSADNPIVIDGGLTQLNDGTYTITADTADISVILCGDAILQGNNATRINFVAYSGFKIIVTVDHNFTFQGKDQNHPLLVTFGGLGDVIFNIVGGKTVNLGSSDGNHPAKAFVLMDDPCYATGEKPTLTFRRACSSGVPTIDSQDVTIAINPHSLLSYLSQQKDLFIAEDQGVILFDPGNVKPSETVPCPGTMVLKLQDGGFVIAGHWVSVPNPIPGNDEPADDCLTCTACLYNQKFTWRDIKLPIAAGHKAIAHVKVSSSACDYSRQGGLRVANHNTTLFELLSDPFCNLGTRTDRCGYEGGFVGSFNGIRQGFVLGANAVLDIAENTFVDYKAFSPNVCPDTIPSVADFDGFTAPAKRLLKKRNPSAFFVDGNNNPDACEAEIRMGKHAGLFFRSLFKSHFDVGSGDLVVNPIDRVVGEGEYVFIVEAPLCVQGENKCDKERSKIEILSLQVSPCGGELFPCDHKKQFPVRTFNRRETCHGDYEEMGGYLAYNKAAFLINDAVCLFDTSLVHTDMNHRVLEKNDVLSEPTYVGGEKWVLGCGKLVVKNDCDATVFDVGRELELGDLSNDSLPPTSEGPGTGPSSSEYVGTIAIDRPFIALFNSRIDVHTDMALTGLDIRVPNRLNDCRECIDNCSKIVFYQNGNRVDDGFGRNLILGTHIGSMACDMCTVINRDVHIDIIQVEEGDYCNNVHTLVLETASNCPSIIECAQKHHSTMRHPGVNTIFLGFDSNISIGVHEGDSRHPRFAHGSPATLCIDGDFFAFSARGGSLCDPRFAHITGQGGIFVDKHGTFRISRRCRRAVMDVMVTRNENGHVDLPVDQVVFGSLFGITDWRLDLSDENRGKHGRDSIVHREEHISHYTFNWIGVNHDEKGFLGYNRKYRPFRVPCEDRCDNPRVKEDNVHGLAKVEGIVDEFQVQGSRIGNEAVVEVNCGRIRELVFVPSCHGGEIPAAIVVLKNDGIVGVGPAFPEAESVFASTTLGINGVTIIADGNGRVELNHDLIIANRCAFFKGPHFASGIDVLEITSDKTRTIRVRSTGCLDFRSFDDQDDIVRFGGNIRLIMEAGSSILMGGGVLQFANDVTVIMEPSLRAQDIFRCLRLGETNEFLDPHESRRAASMHHPLAPLTKCGYNVRNTDEFRIKIHGQGLIQLKDDARLFIDKNAFVGIETLHHHRHHGDHSDHGDHRRHGDDRDDRHDRHDKHNRHDRDHKKSCVKNTDITIELNDNALFSLGGDTVSQGGVLQIGNTEHHKDHDVRFRLLVNGLNARFFMGPQAFLGLNGGIVRQGEHEAPNDWIVDVLWNVSDISIDVEKGLFSHAQIYSGDDHRASLLLIGNHSSQREADEDGSGRKGDTIFNLFYPRDGVTGSVRNAVANIHGGGNIAVITDGLGSFHPVVLGQDGTIDLSNDQRPKAIHTHMRVGVLASRVLMNNDPAGYLRALEFFKAIKLVEAISDPNSRNANLAVAAIDETGSSGIATDLRLVAIDHGTINRAEVTTVLDMNGGTDESKLRRAANVGAVGIMLNKNEPAPSSVDMVIQTF